MKPPPTRLFISKIPSGNCYKVQLQLALQGLRCPTTALDILANPPENRTPEFLALNLNGRVPLLQLADGTNLAESNAILFYLAAGTPYLPRSPLQAAQTLQWMFFEQYSHEPNIAVLRYLYRWGNLEGQPKGTEDRLRTRGSAALSVMEQHLTTNPFFIAGRLTIADVALFAYTHVAPEAGFSLVAYPAIRDWLDRVIGSERFVPMAMAE
ncbi:MAG: glutathione S-transferase [Myxococcota bacterium]